MALEKPIRFAIEQLMGSKKPSSPNDFNSLIHQIVQTIGKGPPVSYSLNKTADIIRAEYFSRHIKAKSLPVGTCIFRVGEVFYWWDPERLDGLCQTNEFFKVRCSFG
jgi:hypothetical protein